MTGKLREGVTATDLVLTVTELLRKTKVVNKFVEYFGEGAASLSPTDRATVANMSPDYGATCGFFAIDEKDARVLPHVGPRSSTCDAIESYLKAQGMFGIPKKGEIDYSQVVELDLVDRAAQRLRPEAARGPHQSRRHQEPLHRAVLEARGGERLQQARRRPGQALPGRQRGHRRRRPRRRQLIAAITSCTNTSNPWVLLAAGLLAKKAVEKGMKPHPRVKTSMAPGSKVVTAYLKDAGLLPYLEQLGFHVVAYGCTTCMGLAGPLDKDLEDTVVKNDLISARGALRQPQLRGARAPEPQGQLPDEPAAGRRVRARRHGAEAT